MTVVTELIGVLLPGGVVAAVVLALQAARSWKEGKQSREEKTIVRWQRLAEQAEEDRQEAELDTQNAVLRENHWRQRAADLEYEMRRNGLEIPPPDLLPPKLKRRGGNARRTGGRAASESREIESLD